MPVDSQAACARDRIVAVVVVQSKVEGIAFDLVAVIAFAPDNPDGDAAAGGSLHGHPVVSSLHVEADLTRLARMEAPLQVGRIAEGRHMDESIHGESGDCTIQS